jgi:hypothetical protein
MALGATATAGSTATVAGANASGGLFDAVYGGNSTSTGPGLNALFGGSITATGSSNVLFGYLSSDGGFSNVVCIGAQVTATAAGQTILGQTSTEVVFGRPFFAGGAAVAAKTIRFTERTGTNRAATSVTWNVSQRGTGTGAVGDAIYNIYSNIGVASGATQHTQVEVMRFTQIETVFNEGSVDRDFRIECDTDTHCFFLDAGAGTVSIGASAAADSAKFYVSGKISASGEVEINGDLNHDGTNIGFYGVAPVARPAAYTQTYATATRTHAALTSATLTDSTTGAANTTVEDVGAAFSQTTLNNNFADLVAQINALRVDLENAKQVLNQVIDDNQLNGILQ